MYHLSKYRFFCKKISYCKSYNFILNREAREERLKDENEKFLIKNRTQLKESNA
jgi:hypothetical protein